MKKALSLLLALLLTGMLAACGNDATNDSVLEAAPSESQKEETTTSETEPPAAELISIEPKFDLDAGTVTLNNGVSMPILGSGPLHSRTVKRRNPFIGRYKTAIG